MKLQRNILLESFEHGKYFLKMCPKRTALQLVTARIGKWLDNDEERKDEPLTPNDFPLYYALGCAYYALSLYVHDAEERILQERARQDDKWGDQSKKMRSVWTRILMEEVGEWAKELNERNYEQAYTELTQVAAVLCQMVEIVEISAIRLMGVEPDDFLDITAYGGPLMSLSDHVKRAYILRYDR